MILSNNHTILKQHFEIHTPRREGALSLQDNLVDSFYQDLLPQLEQVFNDFSSPDECLQIGKLEVSVPITAIENISKEFPSRFLIAVTIELNKIIKDGTAEAKNGLRRTPIEEAFTEQLIFFLETGTLPWGVSKGSASIHSLEKELLRVLTYDPELFKHRLKRIFEKKPEALNRLIYQFSDEVLVVILAPQKVERGRNQEGLNRNEKFLNALRNKLQNESTVDTSREKFDKKHIVTKESPSEDAIYLNHAGIVILHPFLQTFFTACGLLDKSDQFRNETCQEKALHLLYLASAGVTEPSEYELPIHKLLCGIELDTPVQRKLELTTKEIEETENLLKSAIANWPALKNTDSPTFRDGFLQREGKLVRIDDGWKLIVETKPMLDILLDRLPWGIGVVKLPWMKELMVVEWG